MKHLFLILSTLVIVWSCSTDDDPQTQEEPSASFNRQAMLVNWADKIIVPAYRDFQQSTNELQRRTVEFTATPNEVNLATLRNQWITSYRAFQKVSMFEIGRAEQLRFRDRMNTYPVNVAEVENFITTGDYNFELPSTNDAQGFPAMDYLLNGLAPTDAEIANIYFGSNGLAHKAYLEAVVESIHVLATDVYNNWETSFRDDFVANNGFSASASVDKLTNDFIFYFEKSLRAGKIGIPAGVFSNEPLPQNVEGLYYGYLSKILALDALDAAEGFFRGRTNNTGNVYGESFETYLDFLNTIKNGADLSDLIIAQFEEARVAIELLNTDFTEQIATDNTAMLNAYDELQRNVILLKVDMLQALSIDVDYVDTDGD